MRSPHTLALILGVTGLGTACGEDRNGPSNTRRPLPSHRAVPSSSVPSPTAAAMQTARSRRTPGTSATGRRPRLARTPSIPTRLPTPTPSA
jgi:hypothetical protein